MLGATPLRRVSHAGDIIEHIYFKYGYQHSVFCRDPNKMMLNLGSFSIYVYYLVICKAPLLF